MTTRDPIGTLLPAFSTVACPDWTLATVFEHAARAGYSGVELRSFGDASRDFACEPAHTAPEKTRRWSDDAGVRVVSLATSCRFDEAIFPPILGNALGDPDRCVRIAKHAVTLAATIEAPLVRVFAFELPSSERRAAGEARIIDRLGKLVDHAHRTGVRVAIENGGSYASGESLLPILRAVNSPLLGACLNVATAFVAGERPAGGIAALGDKLFMLRVKDLRPADPATRADGPHRAMVPCQLGTGSVPVLDACASARRAGLSVPVVFEWDRAWMPQLDHADAVLSASAKWLHDACRAGTVTAAHAG